MGEALGYSELLKQRAKTKTSTVSGSSADRMPWSPASSGQPVATRRSQAGPSNRPRVGHPEPQGSVLAQEQAPVRPLRYGRRDSARDRGQVATSSQQPEWELISMSGEEDQY